jgi:transcriptional regulator with PAS, ATPase and Fis domain
MAIRCWHWIAYLNNHTGGFMQKVTQATCQWFFSESPAMKGIERDIQLAAQTGIHVLIIGETGTGKEIIARRIHDLRRDMLSLSQDEAPFLPINCGAIPEALAESLLFGHERGAFTSARERQLGKFELAKRGTLFLDEVQTLSTQTQVKLLRVLQYRELERLGSKAGSEIHCQVLAATNIPLEYLIEKSLFRKDLFYRLNLCPIYLPALRHRKAELPQIIRGLMDRLAGAKQFRAKDIAPEAYEILLNHSWPGNLRELEHALHFAGLRGQERIEASDLPPSLTGSLEEYLRVGDWRI